MLQETWRWRFGAAAGLEVLEAVSRPVAMDAFEAEKAKWLGGALGHVVRWRDASEVGQ